jgi:hypothetical protein
MDLTPTCSPCIWMSPEHKVKVLHKFLSHSVSYNYRDELTLDPLSAHTHLHHTPCHKFCLLCIIILHFYMIYAQARSAHRHTSPKIKMLGCKNFYTCVTLSWGWKSNFMRVEPIYVNSLLKCNSTYIIWKTSASTAHCHLFRVRGMYRTEVTCVQPFGH